VTYDPNTRPVNQARRKDRAIEDTAWIEAFLLRAPYGTLASAVDGQPFTNTNLFVYDPTARALYLHTAREGRTRTNLERNPLVCFSASEMGRLLPASEALEFSVEYAGVTVFGRAGVVEDAEEARRALQKLLDKYFPHLRPGPDYRPIQPEELARTAVYRIDIESWSAKQKKAALDFPGAFRFGDHDGETASAGADARE
jgi:nitroimidazol reductase NimA-like FMN-containing flavoprotein (pyridoxamine 5'-phosphate oxidase superfamily)